MGKRKPLSPDRGGVEIGFTSLHLLAARFVETGSGAVVLAYRIRGLQLRDSAGLSPASPLSLPSGGEALQICLIQVVKMLLGLQESAIRPGPL